MIWTLSSFFSYTVCLSPSRRSAPFYVCSCTPSTWNALPRGFLIEPTPSYSGLSANHLHILGEACHRDPYKTAALLPTGLSATTLYHIRLSHIPDILPDLQSRIPVLLLSYPWCFWCAPIWEHPVYGTTGKEITVCVLRNVSVSFLLRSCNSVLQWQYNTTNPE